MDSSKIEASRCLLMHRASFQREASSLKFSCSNFSLKSFSGQTNRALKVSWLFGLVRCCLVKNKEKAITLMGAPCVSHSKTFVFMRSRFRVGLAFVLHKVYDSRFKKPRMGRQDGFGNPMTKKLHDIGARFMIETALCIHENVTEYQEDNAHKLLRNR